MSTTLLWLECSFVSLCLQSHVGWTLPSPDRADFAVTPSESTLICLHCSALSHGCSSPNVFLYQAEDSSVSLKKNSHVLSTFWIFPPMPRQTSEVCVDPSGFGWLTHYYQPKKWNILKIRAGSESMTQLCQHFLWRGASLSGWEHMAVIRPADNKTLCHKSSPKNKAVRVIFAGCDGASTVCCLRGIVSWLIFAWLWETS